MAQIKAFILMLQNLCHRSYYSGGARKQKVRGQIYPPFYQMFFLNFSLKTFLNLSSFGAMTNAQ